MSDFEKVTVRLAASIEIAEIRTAQFDGKEHLVVPVACMVGDIVVRAQGSRGPEFVPAAELMKAPSGWDGRPVIMNHPPPINGQLVSANSPEGLEAACFGRMFHTEYRDGKLWCEVYLDPTRAEAVGAEAIHAVERLRAGEVVEVSVGAIVSAEKRNGTAPNGDKYEYIWHDIVPDHLAILSAGSTGACSVNAGCGALRASEDVMSNELKSEENFITRFLNRFRGAGPDKGQSDVELRGKISQALNDNEPGFMGIVEVYPKSSSVIYEVYVENKYKTKRRTYTTGDDGVKLNSDDAEVALEVSYVAVAAANEGGSEVGDVKPEPKAACGCGGHANAGTDKEVLMSEKNKELAGRVIALKGSPFTEDQRAALEAMPEATLTALATQLEPKVEVTQNAAPAPKVQDAPAPKQLTADEFLALAPEEIRTIVTERQAADASEKQSLVKQLAGAQTVFTEAQLAEKSLSDLRAFAQVAGSNVPVSFVGAGGARVERQAGKKDGYDVTAPLNGYTKALEANRAKA